jgi:hypothetical protein
VGYPRGRAIDDFVMLRDVNSLILIANSVENCIFLEISKLSAAEMDQTLVLRIHTISIEKGHPSCAGNHERQAAG